MHDMAGYSDLGRGDQRTVLPARRKSTASGLRRRGPDALIPTNMMSIAAATVRRARRAVAPGKSAGQIARSGLDVD